MPVPADSGAAKHGLRANFPEMSLSPIVKQTHQESAVNCADIFKF